MKELLKIYWIFFKMGAVTFGGGYTMLPILKREIVEKNKWVSEEMIVDYYALSQGLPGVIAVNVSVFIGYMKKGVAGAIASALGVVSPCLIIISSIAFFMTNFSENEYIGYALSGVSVCVLALIIDAVIGLWKKGVKSALTLTICVATFLLSFFDITSPIVIVLSIVFVAFLLDLKERKLTKGGEK